MAQVIVKQFETPVKVSTTNEVVKVTTEEVAVQVKAYDVIQVSNPGSGGDAEGYYYAFVNTQSIVVPANIHGVTKVKGVRVLDATNVEFFGNVEISQTTQQVEVAFRKNMTGTLIIY